MKQEESGKVFLEGKDHAPLWEALLDKLEATGLMKESQVIMLPATVDAAWMMKGMMESGRDMSGTAWVPAMKGPPASRDLAVVVYLCGKVEKDGETVLRTKKWFEALAKAHGLKKKAKGAIEIVAAPFTFTKVKTLQGATVVAAFYVGGESEISFHVPPGIDVASMKDVSLDDAGESLGWESDYAYLEKHEVVLDKLKTELWD